MSKHKKIIKWSVITILGLVITIVSFGFWFMSLLPPQPVSSDQLADTRTADLKYLTEDIISKRGKILAVVTSASQMGDTDKSTGYELTELARAYYVFEANGFEVDITSPLGGTPPVVIDKGDMREYDYAFLNDPVAQKKVESTIPVSEINHSDYSAIYFVGGKGAMFDFPTDQNIHKLVKDFYEEDKVIGAVCHGPAALLNVTLSDGQSLLKDKKVSCFTSEEELFLIPDAREIFPFLLDEEITANGGQIEKGEIYLRQVSIDGKLVTGQNPWSTWKAAESIIKVMGYEPKPRIYSAEERSVTVLRTYEDHGVMKAKESIESICMEDPFGIERELLAVHSIVAAMQWDLQKSVDLIRLLRSSNSFLE